jgi:hypothetical protein
MKVDFNSESFTLLQEWTENIEIDIKYNFEEIDDNYIFIKNLDQKDNDLYYNNNININEYKNICNNDDISCGFNTLGFFKKSIEIESLIKSPYFNEKDGLYIKKSYYELSIKIIKVAKLLNKYSNKILYEEKESYCFIHSCYLKESGTKILNIIISYIKESNLFNKFKNIFIINIGENICEDYFNDERIIVINFSNNIYLVENITISIMQSFCKLKKNCNILYLHTKGIRTNNKNISDWTDLMLYFLINKYDYCLKLLKNYDTIGCNFQKFPKLHFSGNFWWVNSDYIKTLSKISIIYKNELCKSKRHESEWWILSNINVKYFCIYNSYIDHYYNPYPKELYINYDLNKIFINKKYRVKLLCNWTTSQKICEEWHYMCEKNFIWKNIEITYEDKNIDYYVIINYPLDNNYYEASKTIIFQMEPWIEDETKNWGVKTWGEWAIPDENKFLSVNGRKQNTHNNAFWQLGLYLSDLVNFSYKKINKISSICSSKYFDPGHITRIDLLKYIELKNDLEIDIYNKDNIFNFKNYKGEVTPDKDKYKGIVNYKYYFMIENNFEENFITEKIWEPILCECLVFYYGCPNISKYINPYAYVELDINDFEKCYQTIKQALQEDWWSQRINIIRQEKQKILNELLFFPRIQKIIEENELKILNNLC